MGITLSELICGVKLLANYTGIGAFVIDGTVDVNHVVSTMSNIKV